MTAITHDLKEGKLELKYSTTATTDVPNGNTLHSLSAAFKSVATGVEYQAELNDAAVRDLSPILKGAPELALQMIMKTPEYAVDANSATFHFSMSITVDTVGKGAVINGYSMDLVLTNPIRSMSLKLAEMEKELTAVKAELIKTNNRLATLEKAPQKK